MQNGKKLLGPKRALRSKRITKRNVCSTQPNVRPPLPESCYDTLILCQCGINARHMFPIDMSEVYDTCVVFDLRL